MWFPQPKTERGVWECLMQSRFGRRLTHSLFDVGELPEKYAGWEIVVHEEGTFRDTILGISIMSTPLNALWPENLEYSMA